jgi:predicted regulator of Ras-like GTPase activity (Roadblock/LC7/MglB family)
MAKSRADQMVDRLRNLQAAAPDIEASAVVSVDGLIMASALQQGVEEDRVSHVCGNAQLGERISGDWDAVGWNRFLSKAIRRNCVDRHRR